MASPQVIGGYPVEIFIHESFDKKFLCNHCSLILRDPVKSYCGHRFCRSCMKSIIRPNEQVRCQSCIEEGKMDEEYSILKRDQMFPDKVVRREMAFMPAKCINPKCTWNGIFSPLEVHMSKCKFKPVPCQQCGMPIEPEALQDHMTKDCPKRRVPCKFCQTEITIEDMEKHNSECPKFPIKCDSCGKKKIRRDKMQYHLDKECPNQKVPFLQESGENKRGGSDLGDPTEDLLQHMKTEMTTVRHARGIVVGCGGAGKTTLLYSLMGKSLDEIKEIKSTRGLQVYEHIFTVKEGSLVAYV